MSIIQSLFTRKTSEPITIDVWDPFEAFSFSGVPVVPPAFSMANMDWKETPEAHVFITDLPGMKKDEVKIEVEEEKVLKISGQRTKGIEDKDNKWHRVERSTEKFLRKVKLPPNTTVDGAKAVLDNGVLTVTVPKENEKKDYVKLIPI
ncbi:18.1 kDa class I heat shock protein-like [Ananas comosus]|uniref:18.1 kDa class I heat shock protein-like n=1 Tax=Ananas comosus TaxID=4615 RepID=A0A199UGY8_ANACO|nr:18.1 kDa class I heat shock protein-like [Ananas comosus]OAY63976.1 18.2 kDa class I heat shock protein [Ananas comosus]